MNRKYHLSIKILISISMILYLLSSTVISSIFSEETSIILKANADTPTETCIAEGSIQFEGTESCEKISNFGNNYREQTKYKLYSVLRGLGLNKMQAIAALGSAGCEGLYYCEGIEWATVRITTSTDEETLTKARKLADGTYTWNQTGNHMHGSLGLVDGTEECRQAYISKYSKKLYDPKERTKFADDTMRGYGATEEEIVQLHQGTCTGLANSTVNGLDPSFYYVETAPYATKEFGYNSLSLNTTFYGLHGEECTHSGATGVGLYGFTGPVLMDLLKYSEMHDANWYDVDNQLGYLVYSITDGKGSSYSLNDYKKKTAHLFSNSSDSDSDSDSDTDTDTNSSAWRLNSVANSKSNMSNTTYYYDSDSGAYVSTDTSPNGKAIAIDSDTQKYLNSVIDSDTDVDTNNEDSSKMYECVKEWCRIPSGGNYIDDDWVDARHTKAMHYWNYQFIKVGEDEYDKAFADKLLSNVTDMAGDPLESALACVSYYSKEEIVDNGIVQSYATPSVLYPQSCGYIMDFEKNDDLYDRNKEIFEDFLNRNCSNTNFTRSGSTYSLFELYGEDLHWYRYFGEATYTPQLLDHIWSAVDQDKTKQLVSFDTIFYDAKNFLSCQVYPGRPRVLSSNDVSNGNTDPRVSELDKGYFDGYSYVVGSAKMALSKYVVSIISYLLGDSFRSDVVEIIDKLEESEAWEILSIPVLAIWGLVVAAFIFSIVRKVANYSTGTSGSVKDIVERIIIGLLCMGFFSIAIASPSTLNSTMSNVAEAIDTLFTASIAKSIEGTPEEEVILCNVNKNSDATNDQIHAILWYKSLFRPWCRGQFGGLNYNELYTQYSNLTMADTSMMPQSNDIEALDEVGNIDTSGKIPFYNSKQSTGDVYVYRGNGVETRNWAAYLYSCGSKYHIDSTLNKKTARTLKADNELYFPHYTLKTTANNPDVEADMFRVIDAQMNISPQYFNNGDVVNNYLDSKTLEPNFIKESTIMIFNTGLLLFMVPVIFQKIFNFILMIITMIKIIWFSILELFKEKTGVKEFFDSLRKHVLGYLAACVKLEILIVSYFKFVDEGFFKLMIYIIICVVVLAFNPKDMRRAYMNLKNNVSRIKNKGII